MERLSSLIDRARSFLPDSISGNEVAIFVTVAVCALTPYVYSACLNRFTKAEPAPPELTQEEKLLKKIADTVSAAETKVKPISDTYSQRVEDFLHRYPKPKPDDEVYTSEKGKLEEDHTKIGEFLLRSLISMDGIECPAELPKVRETRRAAIKQLQSIINSADSDWKKIDGSK